MEKQTHDEYVLWQALFDAAAEGMVVLRLDGSVYRANRRYAELLGYSLDELKTLHVWDWDTRFTPDQLREMLRMVDAGGAFFETQQCRKDGSFIAVELSNNAALYKGEKLIFCIVRDITARKKAEEQIRRMATTDDLTGICNRQEFSRVLANEMERTRRNASPLSVIMYDLDHFKQVNDDFGHATGDAVLRTVSALVTGTLRSIDVHGRWGGEEFMVLLPDTGLDEAASVAEKLRRTIVAHPFDKVGSVTASFGVVEFQEPEDATALLQRVDQALYRAKHRGRNRVER